MSETAGVMLRGKEGEHGEGGGKVGVSVISVL